MISVHELANPERTDSESMMIIVSAIQVKIVLFWNGRQMFWFGNREVTRDELLEIFDRALIELDKWSDNLEKKFQYQFQTKFLSDESEWTIIQKRKVDEQLKETCLFILTRTFLQRSYLGEHHTSFIMKTIWLRMS
jgi:hypothetical protein